MMVEFVIDKGCQQIGCDMSASYDTARPLRLYYFRSDCPLSVLARNTGMSISSTHICGGR